MSKALIIGMVIFFVVSCSDSNSSEYSSCTGDSDCDVCTDCSRCAYCNDGGSCGVCE